MASSDTDDTTMDCEPLLVQHRAALFELRENLARLKELLKIEEPGEPLRELENPILQAR